MRLSELIPAVITQPFEVYQTDLVCYLPAPITYRKFTVFLCQRLVLSVLELTEAVSADEFPYMRAFLYRPVAFPYVLPTNLAYWHFNHTNQSCGAYLRGYFSVGSKIKKVLHNRNYILEKIYLITSLIVKILQRLTYLLKMF